MVKSSISLSAAACAAFLIERITLSAFASSFSERKFAAIPARESRAWKALL
jgi:hypothetical protein